MNMLRSDACGAITSEYIGDEVKLCGWVRKTRDLGGITFIDLWDRTGIVQIKFDPEVDRELQERASKLHLEYVIQVVGEVQARPEDAINPDLSTGEVEVIAESLELLNRSQPLPFVISDEEPTEEIRLKYRYLDLRRPEMQKNILVRHRMIKAIRDYLDEVGFVEIETPILMKATPEGARDYLVPSRVHKGKFYALPQSPQMYKQLLMVAGLERYFQIAHCFRDEDLRGHRQPEFIQLDIEASFVEQEDIYLLTEGMFGYAFEETLGVQLDVSFPRISYSEAIRRYGTDKPDTRFGLELEDITELMMKTDIKFARKIIEEGGIFIGLRLPERGNASRSELEEIEKLAIKEGAGGLIQLVVEDGGLTGNLAKHIPDEVSVELIELFEADERDLLLLAGGDEGVTREIMGRFRVSLAKREELIPKNQFNFLWVTEFPLFELTEEGNITSSHHPFTAPVEEDIPLLDENPLEVSANAYDIVCNGVEVGGGSIRIHDPDLQRKVFGILGLSDEEVEQKFGFFLEAFNYGMPPHGGIAPGLDRLIMLACGEESIRNVMAFPKTLQATSLMSGEPTEVPDEVLKELGLRIVEGDE